jgi:hypothetical protein
MFDLTPGDGVCSVWFIYPDLCWFWCPEIRTSSVDLAELNSFLPEDGNSPVPKHFKLKKQNAGEFQKVNNFIKE